MLSIRRLYDVDKEVIVWRKIEKPGVGRPPLGPAIRNLNGFLK